MGLLYLNSSAMTTVCRSINILVPLREIENRPKYRGFLIVTSFTSDVHLMRRFDVML
jgi:hypothetical protein